MPRIRVQSQTQSRSHTMHISKRSMLFTGLRLAHAPHMDLHTRRIHLQNPHPLEWKYFQRNRSSTSQASASNEANWSARTLEAGPQSPHAYECIFLRRDLQCTSLGPDSRTHTHRPARMRCGLKTPSEKLFEIKDEADWETLNAGRAAEADIFFVVLHVDGPARENTYVNLQRQTWIQYLCIYSMHIDISGYNICACTHTKRKTPSSMETWSLQTKPFSFLYRTLMTLTCMSWRFMLCTQNIILQNVWLKNRLCILTKPTYHSWRTMLCT